MLPVASEVKIHAMDATKRQIFADAIKRNFSSIEPAGKVTPQIKRQIKARNEKADAAAHS